MFKTPLRMERGGLDLENILASERGAVVTSALSFLIALLLGIGLLLSAHQPWFPFEQALARTLATLSGASLAGVAAFPLMQVAYRAEKIRILREIREETLATTGQGAKGEAGCVPDRLISELYEEPLFR